MPEKRIPDPTLMARLQLSVKGVDWAASLVRAHQHEQPGGEWSARQQLIHLLGAETESYQPRLARMLAEDRPVIADWDPEAYMLEDHSGAGDIEALAERFMREREKIVDVFKSLTPDQWARTAIWPDGREVDVAWLAEKVLMHGLQHFAGLLWIHQMVEPRHAPGWMS